MKTGRLHLAASLALLALTALPAVGDAAERPERYEVKTPHSRVKAGAARVTVHAPIHLVRRVVTDYAGYEASIRRFEKARVVGRSGDRTDVYLRVPILKGAASVWAVVRFEAPTRSPSGEEVVVGRMVKGNVKRLDAWWRLARVDDETTRLNLELLIEPDLPVPGSLVTGEVAYAAEKAVRGVLARSEQLRAR